MLTRPTAPAYLEWHTVTEKQATARAARTRAASEMRRAVPEDSSLSFLEWRTVRGPTRQEYSRRVIRFVTWCCLHSMNWTTDDDLDSILVTLFDELFFKGMSAEEGTRLIAALCFFLPMLGRFGRGCLPRAHRSLRGWRLVDPQRERLPLPMVVIAAMVGHACHRGALVSGFKWWIQFRTYLRPGEAEKLLVSQLIPPTPAAGEQYANWSIIVAPEELEVPGKTGDLDESVVIDTDPELRPLLAAIFYHRHPSARLWGASAEDPSAFAAAVAALHLQPLHPCRYALRHGGASEDLLTFQRDLAAIKKRGRLKTDSSLRRYAKEAKLSRELRNVHPLVVAYGRAVLVDLAGVISGERPQTPPFLA